ncbi:MAG: DUF84 family protein [Firmicutes bacterium]|nr:DUF84 family protein [Bacillota bacterium]
MTGAGEPSEGVRVAVGSRRRAKVEAVAGAVARLWPGAEIVAVDVPSGVREQPVGLAETRRGAAARARAARRAAGAAFGFGLESGVVWRGRSAWAVNVVCACDSAGRTAWAEGPRFPLPPAVSGALRAGLTLAEAARSWSGAAFSPELGVVHLLTEGAVERADLWRAAVALAAAPLRHPEWYAAGEAGGRRGG